MSITRCEEEIQYERIEPTTLTDVEISTHTREDRKEEKKEERGVDNGDGIRQEYAGDTHHHLRSW